MARASSRRAPPGHERPGRWVRGGGRSNWWSELWYRPPCSCKYSTTAELGHVCFLAEGHELRLGEEWKHRWCFAVFRHGLLHWCRVGLDPGRCGRPQWFWLLLRLLLQLGAVLALALGLLLLLLLHLQLPLQLLEPRECFLQP